MVTSRCGADGRTIKTVTLSWRCGPDENAEEIAATLNAKNEKYLRGLNREKLVREGERELIGVSEPVRRSASVAIHRLKLADDEEAAA